MNSFTLTAVGQLARNPELVAKGNTAYTKFCLVGNDYAGKDEEGAAREVVTSLWFVAFGALGEAIARHSRKGDQLFVEARVRGSNWTDKQGDKQYDHSFVVQGFRFGAPGRTKREERANGPDRSANNGAYLSLGRGASVVPHADGASNTDLRAAADSAAAAAAADGPVGGANESAGGNEDAGANTESDPAAGAELGTTATVGPIAKGNDDVLANEVAGAGGGVNPVASGTTKEGARRVAGASRTSEKTSGGRSSRRAAAGAA